MSYICNNCNKSYNTYSGLFRHNKKYHLDDINNEQKNIKNNCKFCNKELSSYSCKWRHEKSCKFDENSMIKKFKILEEKVHNLKSKLNCSKTINSNNINSNNTNNQNIICVFPLGKEPDNILSVNYIEKTLKEHGLNSIIEILKKKHFNPELPHCQNFCVTSRNDTYASVVDPETKKIKYVNKKDIFDKVYMGIVSNVETVNNLNKEQSDVKETIDKIKNIPSSQKMLKKLHIGINEEAYHNKELVKNTWEYANFDIDENQKIIVDLNISDDDIDYEINDNINNKKLIIKQIQNLLTEIKNTVI